jgi:hypothetical protein
MALFSQRRSVFRSIAPDWRAASLPLLKAISVGMPRIPKREESAGLSSELTFAKRALVLKRRAASSYYGAIIRHGPHHGAQKSTINGRSLRVKCCSNRAESNSIG